MSHFLKLTGIVVFMFFSLACATQEEIRDRREARCSQQYGYIYGTDAMAQCVERMGRDADKSLDRMAACAQAYPFGSPAYNICISR